MSLQPLLACFLGWMSSILWCTTCYSRATFSTWKNSPNASSRDCKTWSNTYLWAQPAVWLCISNKRPAEMMPWTGLVALMWVSGQCPAVCLCLQGGVWWHSSPARHRQTGREASRQQEGKTRGYLWICVCLNRQQQTFSNPCNICARKKPECILGYTWWHFQQLREKGLLRSFLRSADRRIKYAPTLKPSHTVLDK